MEDFNLEKTLKDLKVEFGTKAVHPKYGNIYYTIHGSIRKEAIRSLVLMAIENGKEREYFGRNDVKLAIAEFCFPSFAIAKWAPVKRKGAYNLVFDELATVLAEVWKNKDIPKGEKTTVKEFDPATQGRMGKDIDPALVKDNPKPIRIVDEEMEKLLGFSDE